MTESLLITGGVVFTGAMRIERGAVRVRDGRIAEVSASRGAAQEGETVIDATGLVVAPGFVDLHVHGGGGRSIDEGTAEAVLEVARAHARFGTTAMLATVHPAPRKECEASLRAAREAVGIDSPGARILGVHLEGPFFNPSRRGAIRAECLEAPSLAVFDRLIAAAGETVRLLSLAPELPGALGIVRRCREMGIVVAVGHSDASHEEMIRGIEAGITHATHLFNAMRPAHHRDPGVVGTVLMRDDVTVELIADFHHVHPVMAGLVLRVKPHDKVALVTDAVTPAGATGAMMSFEVAGRGAVVSGGTARLADGTIAGSILTMNRAVANVVSAGLAPIEDALRMASSVPAGVIGMGRSKGVLAPGADADIVIMDDAFDVKMTVAAGMVLYRSEDFGGMAR